MTLSPARDGLQNGIRFVTVRGVAAITERHDFDSSGRL
jgi:hypothetical protein